MSLTLMKSSCKEFPFSQWGIFVHLSQCCVHRGRRYNYKHIRRFVAAAIAALTSFEWTFLWCLFCTFSASKKAKGKNRKRSPMMKIKRSNISAWKSRKHLIRCTGMLYTVKGSLSVCLSFSYAKTMRTNFFNISVIFNARNVKLWLTSLLWRI